MNDENSVTAGTRPRRTLRKVKTNVHTKRAVIRIVLPADHLRAIDAGGRCGVGSYQHQDSAKARPTDLESTVVWGFGPMRQKCKVLHDEAA